MPRQKINDYTKVKIGTKAYDDVALDLNYFKKIENYQYNNKAFVMEALMKNDIVALRKISNYFYRTNGIYQKVINYLATMYRFDWYMVAEPFTETVKEEKVVEDFSKVLTYFDNSHIKKLCGEFSLAVIKDGVYYGYAYEGNDNIIIQELPWQWCRSRFKIGNMPAIEFDMKFFDEKFPSVGRRMQVLDLFPPEFKKGYMLYKQRKLPADDPYVTQGYGSWYLLDPGCAFRFSLMGTAGLPLLVNAIPEIIDLGVAQGIDRKRQLQKLLKIIVHLNIPLPLNLL